MKNINPSSARISGIYFLAKKYLEFATRISGRLLKLYFMKKSPQYVYKYSFPIVLCIITRYSNALIAAGRINTAKSFQQVFFVIVFIRYIIPIAHAIIAAALEIHIQIPSSNPISTLVRKLIFSVSIYKNPAIIRRKIKTSVLYCLNSCA